MKRHILVCGLLVAALSAGVKADDKHSHIPTPPNNAGMAKMKSLIGTWVKVDDKGDPTDEVVSVIKLTAGGSAVQETLFPGQPHEMVSMYTVDGDNLLMTHYCMLGNQPQMKADPKSPANQLKFDFVGGTNLNPTKY